MYNRKSPDFWFPKINDSSLKYLTPRYSVDVYETDVVVRKAPSFNIWKSNCNKFKCVFVKIIKSEYVYAIVPDLNFEIVGIWSISEQVGYNTKLIKFQPLLTLVDMFVIIPDNKLVQSNQDIFNFDSTVKLKEIKDYSKELFTKFLLDSNYKNVPKESLAIKAIKASNSFHESIEEYSKVYFSAKG